jgi:anti-anti-sigma regulatory factor
VRDRPALDAKITRRYFDTHAVLYLEGHFDFTNIGSFETALHAHAREGGIVSLERMRFADGSVLSALVRLSIATNGRVIFILPSALPVARLFTLTNMEGELRLVRDFAQARALAERLAECTGH